MVKYQDRGPQYQTAIFYTNDHQKELAETYIEQLKNTINADKAIATKILPASQFLQSRRLSPRFFIRKIQSVMQKNKKIRQEYKNKQ